MASTKKWITLNVGGTTFLTSRSTIVKSTPTNSPLYRISTNSTNVSWDRDERGAYMIDRDPDYFRPVLNYLRTGHLLLGRDIPEEAILLEAEYFNLPDLVAKLRQRQTARIKHLRHQQLDSTLNGGSILAAITNNQHQNHNHHHHQQQQQQQQQQIQSIIESPLLSIGHHLSQQPLQIQQQASQLSQPTQLASPSAFESQFPMGKHYHNDFLTSFVNQIMDEAH